MICPSCRQDVAPIVRGVRAYCTACRAPMPITSAPEAINVTGQPAKVGGGIAKVLGWLVLGGGLTFAFFFAIIAWVLATAVPLYVGGFFAVLAALVAIPLLLTGRRLQQSGEDREQAARERALFALAAQHRGILTVPAVARALEMQDPDADALLTTLAKRPDGRVTLEVDDAGNLTYVFRDLVAASSPAARVRIGAEGWQAPTPAQAQAPKPRVIDAELLDEEEDVAEGVRHVMR